MKVLHVETGRHLYGGARQVLYLLQGLRQRGIENVLVCAQDSAIRQDAAPWASRVQALPMRGDADLAFIWRLRRLLRQERPDLVHLHSRRGADILGGLAARWAGLPVVLSRRVDNPEPAWLLRSKYRLYDAVITISDGIRQVLLKQGLPSEKVVLVHSAVDSGRHAEVCDRPAFRQAFGLPADVQALGMIAQLIPRKGHQVLLDALPRILQVHPEARVILFGKGPLEAELRQQIQRAGLQERVQLAGFREDLPKLLSCLDLVVHPAYMEGLGVSLLQAAAAGVPIVAARAGGIPEVVRDGENGLLVEPGDAPALADAVITLLGDPARRQQMGRAGQALVSHCFSIDAMVEGNLAVYQRVLARHGAERTDHA